MEAACEGGAVWRPPVRGARCGGLLVQKKTYSRPSFDYLADLRVLDIKVEM